MKFKIFILFFIVMGLVLSNPNFAYSESSAVGGNKEEIDDLNKKIANQKAKIKEMEETMAKYQKSINATKLQAVSLKNQISILNNRLAQTESEVQITEGKINEAKMEIEALELSITDKEAIIKKQQIIIAKMVRNISADDQKNYLEIMLTSNSFADFYNQVKYLQSVYSDLGQSVKNLRLAKDDLNFKKAQVEGRKKVYEDLKTELDNKKMDLQEQNGTKNTLLVQTKSSEARYQTMLSTLRSQYQATENEISANESLMRKKLAALEKKNNTTEDTATGELSWPVPSHYITAEFHDSSYPFRNVFEHSGMDIRASQGTAVHAAAAGYVARAKRCTLASCYSYVLIVHNSEVSTLYGHLSSISVADDGFVARGDVIGYSGGTPGTVGAGPFVTGPHLHFEVRKNGIPVNPASYLN
ncbi:MAG: peptidoglycan DD-metalloendopeptidase family protein [Patescibacteria group bacterium]